MISYKPITTLFVKSPIPICPSSFPLLTGNHYLVLHICESNAFLFISAILESKTWRQWLTVNENLTDTK